MKILLIFFTFSLISGAVRCVTVTGYSGGSVLVDSGKLWFSNSAKYTAKLPEWRTIINDTKHDKWINEGRFTLFKNNEGKLMIYIRELNQHDAGRYAIEVLHKWRIYMTLNVEEDSCCKISKRVMVNIGETASFSCEYSQNYINYPKIIFKEGEDSIETIYSTLKKTERFSVSDDKQKNIFSVRITAVTPDDGGVYLCGVWIYSHSYSYSIINTVHLHVIVAPVVKHEGESAEIFCPYDSTYKSKSLCKGKCSTRDRNTLNETVREEKDTKTDRLTLNEDVTASVFTGTITGLTAEDAGKYWCAVTLERDVNYLYTHLIVIMNEELNLTKYEGDDMSIQCKHHDELQKCFCKAHEPSVCVKDGVSLEKIRDDRFSFSDEASTGVFTVNITDLREEDSGIYWCGAHITTKVNLEVKKNFSARIVISCVCVSLLLIGASVLLLYKLRYIKTRDQHSSTDGTEMSSAKAPQAACDYENIRDVRQRIVSGTGDDVLYSNAKLSTDSSDLNHTLYSTVQLPTIPSDGLLYASVRFQKHKESVSDAKVTFNNEEIYTTVSPRMRLN
ncbi:polymeric immunoglobulin receptor-like [Rhinichthys klamathensis goyatoka]|uniref:polymeric immunoglobulin receptor-like n=1 Tax=Rhinichthys klamathensis goyatoka TaxID=3034132 RepID=UPI0024B5BE89|nr:polymeric immunoglobulin receptor-like [Rhinichthys klamathensis goyatoka]